MKLNSNYKRIRDTRGFTLLETLVAIAILTISITGPLAFAQTGLRASFIARDQMIAFALAQDAIESIKNIRDTNALQGNPWLSFLDACINGACNIDTSVDVNRLTSNHIQNCVNDFCPLMKFNDSTGVYSFNPADPESIFHRTIFMRPATDASGSNKADEYVVVVEVEWDTHSTLQNRRIVVQENIFNWTKSIIR